MVEKNKIKITEISLNNVPYQNTKINPTNINFFIGKNGTGKSTIGRNIRDKKGLTWKNSNDENETIIQVYNDDYIRDNLKTLNNIPGVFNISQEDIEVENKINELIKKLDESKKNRESAIEKGKEIVEKLLRIKEKSEGDTWDIIKPFIEKYSNQSIINKRSKEKAYQTISTSVPKSHTIDELDTLYSVAFNPNAKTFSLLKKISIAIPTYDLSSPIIGQSNNQFSSFIKQLNNIDWVRQGHIHYENNEKGVCPYCQQPLTESIIKSIRDCFDETYEQAINELKAFSNSYGVFKESLRLQIAYNKEDWFDKVDEEKYDLLADEIIDCIENNEEIIKNKIQHLSNPYELIDVSNSIERINNFIESANEVIQKNNDLVGPRAKDNFNNALKEHLSFLCSSIIHTRNDDEKIKNDEQAKARVVENEAIETISFCNKNISELSEKTTSTKPVVEHINNFLKESNFQGFSIISSDERHYKLVRPDGTDADFLSEGEKNFICFLYFYFSLFGSFDGSKTLKDRVVVIDDPVSSMDSDSVFIISFLIRHLIEVCKNAITYNPTLNLDTHIKQLFILTHNSFFYNEIAPIYIEDYEFVNYYEITKNNNVSNISIGIKTTNPGEITEKKVNYIPRLGSYATLWEEYKEAKTAPIMLNVQRRIIESYFLQNLGITPGDLYSTILEEHKDSFEITENGHTDYVDVILAKAMLCYIGTSSTSMNSNLYYSTPTDDLQRFRNTFKKIFYVMNQKGHYEMMMKHK